VANAGGISGTSSVPDPTYEFSSVYTPKISVIPLFVNVHWRTRLTAIVGLDAFAGPVFQIVQFGFRRDASSGLNSLSETETFNASGTALGFQAGLTVSFRVFRGVAIVAEGFYRSSKITNVKGNWFLNTTTSSGTVTQSNSAYYLWYYNDNEGAVYPRIGFFDTAGPTGANISGARKANLNISGAMVMVGVRFGI
jgi:hypothetical protein